jgi:hypothetical protein
LQTEQGVDYMQVDELLNFRRNYCTLETIMPYITLTLRESGFLCAFTNLDWYNDKCTKAEILCHNLFLREYFKETMISEDSSRILENPSYTFSSKHLLILQVEKSERYNRASREEKISLYGNSHISPCREKLFIEKSKGLGPSDFLERRNFEFLKFEKKFTDILIACNEVESYVEIEKLLFRRLVTFYAQKYDKRIYYIDYECFTLQFDMNSNMTLTLKFRLKSHNNIGVGMISLSTFLAEKHNSNTGIPVLLSGLLPDGDWSAYKLFESKREIALNYYAWLTAYDLILSDILK